MQENISSASIDPVGDINEFDWVREHRTNDYHQDDQISLWEKKAGDVALKLTLPITWIWVKYEEFHLNSSKQIQTVIYYHQLKQITLYDMQAEGQNNWVASNWFLGLNLMQAS